MRSAREASQNGDLLTSASSDASETGTLPAARPKATGYRGRRVRREADADGAAVPADPLSWNAGSSLPRRCVLERSGALRSHEADARQIRDAPVHQHRLRVMERSRDTTHRVVPGLRLERRRIVAALRRCGAGRARNAVSGDAIAIDCENCVVLSEGTAGGVWLRGLCVVERATRCWSARSAQDVEPW